MTFRLRNIPLLSRVGLDRADELRSNPEELAKGWGEAGLITLDVRGRVNIVDGQVVLEDAARVGDVPPEHAVFLGRIPGGRHVWAVRAELDDDSAPLLDLRRSGQLFDDTSAALLATAMAMLAWHDSAGYSPVDGSPTTPAKGGWVRVNSSTGQEEFPRPTLLSSAWCTTAVTAPYLAVRSSGRSGCSRCWRGSSRRASRWRRVWPARSPRKWV